MRTSFALAAGTYLALTSVSAFAGGSSSENRGYGGPLNVGPNFEQGGQHTPPVYGTKPAKKRAAIKPQKQITKTRKAPAKKDPTPAAAEPETNPASTGVAPAADTTDTGTSAAAEPTTSSGTATSTATTCKRFDSTAGQTITVPCQ